jgi:Na+-translocating ferredoxin:NAD+ oxidoreductase RnfG subunit
LGFRSYSGAFTKGVTTSIVFLILLSAGASLAKVYSTKAEALKKAFPDAVKVERKNLFLTDDDIKRISELARAKVESKLFTYYRAVGSDGVMGYAVIQSHVVRTKPVVYMAVIAPDGSLDHVEILAFYEPGEYLPSTRWLGQFMGKRLSERLWINRDIQAITGATISSYTMTREIRKVLAIFELKMEVNK